MDQNLKRNSESIVTRPRHIAGRLLKQYRNLFRVILETEEMKALRKKELRYIDWRNRSALALGSRAIV